MAMGPHDLIVCGLFENERSTFIIVLVSHTDDASKASRFAQKSIRSKHAVGPSKHIMILFRLTRTECLAGSPLCRKKVGGHGKWSEQRCGGGLRARMFVNCNVDVNRFRWASTREFRRDIESENMVVSRRRTRQIRLS